MKILFYVSKLYSIPVVQPLIARSRKLGIPNALLASEKVSSALEAEKYSGTVFTTIQAAAAFMPDFVLCPGNFVDHRLPGLKVELFHGIGVEKPSHYRIRHFFDIYLTSGPVVTERFIRLREKYGYFSVHETGWPKIDHIVTYNTTGLRERLGIPEHHRVILYAPTHSRKMQSADEVAEALPGLKKPDETWFCKPHELMDRTLTASLKDMNVRMVDHFDITPYLHAADVLVSDTSSVVYEFMVLGKPVVTLKALGNRDKCINVESPHQLRAAIDRSLNLPEEFRAKRREYVERVNPKTDGSVSRGILDLLAGINPEDHPPRGRKPLNLFRKIQIIYHSRYRKGYIR